MSIELRLIPRREHLIVLTEVHHAHETALYPAALRQQMVERVEAGRSLAEPTRECDVRAQTIAKWVGQTAVGRGKPPLDKRGTLTSAEREEVIDSSAQWPVCRSFR